MQMSSSSQLRGWSHGSNLIIQERSQEISILFSRDLTGEVLRRQMKLIAFRGFGGEFVGLLFEQFLSVRFVDFLAFGCGDAVFAPLPELAAADFCCGCVLL